jgi:hypothetical protein
MPDPNEQGNGSVIALAGRRVDAADADARRFPLDYVPIVRERLVELFVAEGAVALVCSGACGADLAALEAAERLGIKRRIVLPFPPEDFRKTSVIDRPGDWGPVFDRLVAMARATGDLVMLDFAANAGETAYAAANRAIVDQARALTGESSACRLVAAVVWEGAARGGSDATEGFRSLAANAGFAIRSVLTR